MQVLCTIGQLAIKRHAVCSPRIVSGEGASLSLDPQPGAPTVTPNRKTMTEFEGVVPALGQALNQRGYAELTPVQKAVLAPELRDADALVSAQTGSGKTVAFGLALAPTLLGEAERFERAETPLALVVAPTRELALQVKRELEWLFAQTGASIASCVGGMDMRTERRALERGVHIVVGTPGRLRDHIDRRSFKTANLRAVVLDEADEMLDLGFREDLEYILDAAPSERRTLMFSATVPRTIANLAKRYQRDAVRVSTQAEQSQHVDIEYRALTVAPKDKENAIVNVLRFYEAKNALVFCSTRAAVNHLTSRFANRGFSVVALSGELNQNERTHALQAMRDGRARVCVATDVAARGIDLPNLELVVHADMPTNSDTLLHRSGRTGRAGRKGVSVMIVPHTQRRRTERLLQNAKLRVHWGTPPSAEEVNARDDERLLADTVLSDPLQEEEQAFVHELLANHEAEQIAAAFVRLYRAGRSAPEELLEVSAPEPVVRERRRDDFENGVWFSLSVGRKQNAEPRWLLPMVCRAGDITKRDIGAIRIQQEETYIELDPGCIDKFLEALGPTRLIEKSINVTQLDGMPSMSSDAGAKHSPPEKRPYSDRRSSPDKSRGSKPDYKSRDRKESGPKRKYDRESGDGARQDKPAYDKPGHDKPRHDKPNHDRPKKDGPKFDAPSQDGQNRDKPKYDKSRDDKPNRDKPRYDKPESRDGPKKPRKKNSVEPSDAEISSEVEAPKAAASKSAPAPNPAADPNFKPHKSADAAASDPQTKNWLKRKGPAKKESGTDIGSGIKSAGKLPAADKSKLGLKPAFDPIATDNPPAVDPAGKPAKRSGAKKPFKVKYAKADSKARGSDKPGSAPLKRKKTKKKPAN